MRFKYKIQSFEDILQLYLFQQKYHFYPFYLFYLSPSNSFFEECIQKFFQQSPYLILQDDDDRPFEPIPKIQKKDILDFSLSHSPLFNDKNELKENGWDMILIWEKEEIQTTYRFMEKYPLDRKVHIYSHFTYDDLEILFWNREVQYIKIPISITKREFYEKWEREICQVQRIYSFGFHPLLTLPLLIHSSPFQVCMNQEPQYLSQSTFYFEYYQKPIFIQDEEKKEEEVKIEIPEINKTEIIYIENTENPILINEFKEDFQNDEVQVGIKEVQVEEEVDDDGTFGAIGKIVDFTDKLSPLGDNIQLYENSHTHLFVPNPTPPPKVDKQKSIKEWNVEKEYLFDITEKNIIGLTYLLCYQQEKEQKIEKIWINKNYLMLLNEANKMLYVFFRDWFHLVHPHYLKIDFYQNGVDIKTKLEVEKILIEIGIKNKYQKMFKEILQIPNYYIEYKNYVILDKNTTEKMNQYQKVIILKNTKEDITLIGDKSILLDHRKYEQYKKMIPFSYMNILHREIELIKNCKKVYYEENSNRYSYNRILFDLFFKRVE